MVVIGANFSPDGLTPEAQTESSEPSRGVARWIKRWWTGAGNRIKELETRVKQMWRTRPNLKPSDLEQITAPTLVVVGESDVVSTSHASHLAKWLGKGSLAILPEGHFAPVIQASRVNHLIVEFFGRVKPNGPAASEPIP